MIDAKISPVKHSSRSRAEIRQKLQERFNNAVPRALEIGCGGNPQPGYIHTDAFYDGNTKTHIDVLCEAADLPFEDATMDSVLMFGVFEHFGYFEIQEVLLEIVRVMRPGGVFKFDVPDFDWFIHAYLTGKDKNTGLALDPVRTNAWCLHGIFGGQDGPGMLHKWGWNAERLLDFLLKPNFGFSAVKLVGKQWRDPESNHLIWECTK